MNKHELGKAHLEKACLKSMPKPYREDFLSEMASLIKHRVKLTIWVFLFTFIGGGALGNILVFGKIRREAMVTWVLLICVCVIVLFLIKRASDIHMARVSAIFMVIMILGLMSWLYITVSAPPAMPIIAYVIMLFAITFTIPWMTCDVLGLSLLHMGVYTLYSYNVQSYIYKDQVFPIVQADFLQGIILLSVASLICMIVKKHENERWIKEFILLKEVEEKNNQMQKELELATRVHSRLVPHSVKTPLANIAVTYLPMHYMGGDYAKFHFLDENKLIFIICDVTGHGVSAALLVNAFDSEFERQAKGGKSPGALLKEMDRFIIGNFAETNMYMTAFCGLLDYGSMKFIYSSYGHPPQYIYQGVNSEIKRILAQTSFLGLPTNDENIYQNELPFYKGDQILLFTDGIIEAKGKGGEDYGDKRLEAFIRKNHSTQVERFNKELLTELNSFALSEFKDDIFILNIRAK